MNIVKQYSWLFYLSLYITLILTCNAVYHEMLNLLIKLFESKDGEMISPTEAYSSPAKHPRGSKSPVLWY